MSDAIYNSGHNIQSIQSSSSQMSPEEAANYIWSDLLGQLQAAYNQQIGQIQQENINDVSRMQQLIQELGVKYQKEVQEISAAYNAVRTPGATQADIDAAIQHAKEAIEAMGAKPEPESPEQKQAKEIDRQANDIVQHNKDEISQITAQLQHVQSAIEAYEKRIADLEKQISDLKKTDPKKAAKAEKQLKQAKKDLATLKNQAKNFSSQIASLQSIQNQIDTKESEINTLIQAIMNGENPEQNLRALQKAFEQLQKIDSTSSSTFAAISKNAEAATKASDALADFLNSIDVSKGGGIDPNPKPDPVPWNSNGQATYFDMGIFNENSFITYPAENNWQATLDKEAFDKYLESLFKSFKDAGINEMFLSFAQLGDIDALLNGGHGDGVNVAADSICKWLQVPGALEEFMKVAHENGIKVNVAMGGEAANANNWTLLQPGQTAEGQAHKLAEFMRKFGIDGLDFDIEGGFFDNNSPADIDKFLKALHSELSADGKKMSITVPGSIHVWPESTLKSLFHPDSGGNIFDYFDDINLMLYGSTDGEYYIDVDGDWGIENWLDIIGKENSSRLHIGFQDMTNYANESKYSPAGDPSHSSNPWDIRPGSTAGEAAAQIYHQLREKLGADGYPTDFGNPFWWPDATGGGGNRYGIVNGESNYGVDMEKDFWKELNKLEGVKSAQAEVQKSEDLVAMARSMCMA